MRRLFIPAMKRKSIVITLSVLLLMLSVVALAASRQKESTGWTNDFKKSSALARSENKYMLLNFTGTDWCSWCIKLQREVFSKNNFKKFANKSLVCVEIDFPKKTKQTEAIKKQNRKLKERYWVNAYPTIIILTPDGKLIGKIIGYRGGGSGKYIEQLVEIINRSEGNPKKDFAAEILLPKNPTNVEIIESGYGSAIIDGKITKKEWEFSTFFPVNIVLPDKNNTTGTIRIMNDKDNIYVGLKFRKIETVARQSFSIEFSGKTGQVNPKTGKPNGYGDTCLINAPRGRFIDGFRNVVSAPMDIHIDGAGKFKDDGESFVYEISHPLKSPDKEHDIQLSPGDSVGFTFSLRLISKDAKYPQGFGDTCSNLYLLKLTERK